MIPLRQPIRGVPVSILLTGIWIAAPITPAALGDDNPARERFLQHYQSHAQLLEEYYTNIHVKYRSFQYGSKGRASGWYLKGKYNLRNEFVEGEFVTLDTKTQQEISRNKRKTVACQNALYSFSLYPGDDGQYAVQKLDMYNGGNEPAPSALSVPFADIDRRKTYFDIARDERSRVLSFQDRIWQNKTTKELRSRFDRLDPKTKKSFTVNVDYYFSPADGWVCCGKKQYGADEPEYIEERYSYESKEGDQLPALKRIEAWLINSRDPAKSRLFRTTDIDEFRRSPTPFPDADFMLSAFGLPEPMGVKPPERSRTWLWLIAAAVGSVALAILFAWFKRRRQAAAQLKPPVH